MKRILGAIRRFNCSANRGCLAFDHYALTGEEVKCPDCGANAVPYHEGKHACAPDQLSEAAGIHPNQIPEAMRRFPHHEYTPDGRMVFHGQKHKDRCLKDIGMVEYDSPRYLKTQKL